MKNIYMTVIPLQGNRDLQKVQYQADASCDIPCNLETRFPIIPVMLATADPEVENKVIAVRFQNSDTERNLNYLKEELEENRLDAEITVIDLEENQRYATGVNMLLQILDAVENDSDVYACITYGTKMMTMLLTYVLNTLEFTRKNTKAKGIYYGEIQRSDRETVTAKLYNFTAFLKMDELIRQIYEIHPEDPEGFLRKLIAPVE